MGQVNKILALVASRKKSGEAEEDALCIPEVKQPLSWMLGCPCVKHVLVAREHGLCLKIYYNMMDGTNVCDEPCVGSILWVTPPT